MVKLAEVKAGFTSNFVKAQAFIKYSHAFDLKYRVYELIKSYRSFDTARFRKH